MANLSQEKREDLINRISKLKENADEDTVMLLNEIANELTNKKYGLVWEEHSENVDELMKENIPIFIEDKDKEIVSDKSLPYNFILEGDNLHSLKLLEKTHKGRIDVIYIDPPYNTENSLTYEDKRVGLDDDFRHSKWLSFINRRLNIASKLLSKNGIIIISIDDNEMNNLVTLCDEIFGSENKIGVLPTIMNLKGNQDEFGFAGTHEYTVIYAKNKKYAQIGEFEIEEDSLDDWSFDDIGYYKQGATLKRTGKDAPREKRPWSYYPILVNNSNHNVSVVNEDEYKQIYDKNTKTFNDDYVKTLIKKYENKNYTVLLPTSDNNILTSWRWQYSNVKNNSNEIIVVNGRTGLSLYKKQRPELGDLPTKKPKSFLYKAAYSSGNGTNRLKEIVGAGLFDNPKPVELIKDLIYLCGKKDSIILDFFAGSGTTGDAVLELNNSDNGTRKFILCTNNEIKEEIIKEYLISHELIENNKQFEAFKDTEKYGEIIRNKELQEKGICKAVTYPRVKTIITGIKNDGSKYSDGISANVKYYKTDFVSKCSDNSEYFIEDELLKHIIEMIQLENGIDIDNDRYIVLLNDEDAEKFERNTEQYHPIKIYVDETVFLTKKTRDDLVRNGVEILPIPEYYFAKDIKG